MGVVGLAENKANSAPIELELGLSLAKESIMEEQYSLVIFGASSVN